MILCWFFVNFNFEIHVYFLHISGSSPDPIVSDFSKDQKKLQGPLGSGTDPSKTALPQLSGMTTRKGHRPKKWNVYYHIFELQLQRVPHWQCDVTLTSYWISVLTSIWCQTGIQNITPCCTQKSRSSWAIPCWKEYLRKELQHGNTESEVWWTLIGNTQGITSIWKEICMYFG